MSFTSCMDRAEGARGARSAHAHVIVAEELRAVLVAAGSSNVLDTLLSVDLVETTHVLWLRGGTCGRRPGCRSFAWHSSLTRCYPSNRGLRHMSLTPSFVRGISSSLCWNRPRCNGLWWRRNITTIVFTCSGSYRSLKLAFRDVSL